MRRMIRVLYFHIKSLPDAVGGEDNPPVNRLLAILPEDTHRCFASGYDVVLFTCIIHVRQHNFCFFLNLLLLPLLFWGLEGPYHVVPAPHGLPGVLSCGIAPPEDVSNAHATTAHHAPYVSSVSRCRATRT